MKHFLNLQIGIVIVGLCCMMTIGCAILYVKPEPPPPRAVITFDYTPPETTPGSADLTFAVVGAEVVGTTAGTPFPLSNIFATNLTKDFVEILTSRGFSVKGPYRDYDIMTYSDKEGSDLVLTAEVLFSSDTTQIRPSDDFGRLKGSIVVSGHVNLIAYESLTKTPQWTKSVAINPIKVKLITRKQYSSNYVDLEILLLNENKFYNDVGRALEGQYTEIMNRIYGYIDPDEMADVGKYAQDLRKRKVSQ